MSWQTPKTNWTPVDGVTAADLNRIEENTRVLSQQGGAFGVTSGTVNAYEVTTTPSITSLTDGVLVAVKVHAQNTGAATINVNGLGAKPIKKANGLDVSSGQLKVDSIVTMRYSATANGGTGAFILQGEGGSGNAQPSDVLSGKTFTNDNGEQTGTMPNNGAITITPTTTDQVIPAGYHNGSGKVVGDPDLTPENIKRGVNIFGVTGTLTPAPNLSSPVFNQNRSTSTLVTVGYGTTGSPSQVAFSIPISFSVCEMKNMYFFLQAEGRQMDAYNARGQIQIKFRATGHVITIADLYVSGLLYSGNKQTSFSNLLLVVSNGECRVLLGGISGTSAPEIMSSIQSFTHPSIDASSGIDVIAYAYCDTTDGGFKGSAQVGPSGTIKAY